MKLFFLENKSSKITVSHVLASKWSIARATFARRGYRMSKYRIWESR